MMDIVFSENKDCVVPVTPEVVRENLDFEFQSPLTLTTVVRKQLNVTHIIDEESNNNNNNNNNQTPRTPKGVVFDPFAHHHNECRTTVSRQLHFCNSSDSLSDQHILETVYHDLLQLILSNQNQMEEDKKKKKKSEHVQEEDYYYDSSDDDDCKSPPSTLRFTGILHTCPGAPLKLKSSANKPKIIPLGLCKKLEF